MISSMRRASGGEDTPSLQPGEFKLSRTACITYEIEWRCEEQGRRAGYWVFGDSRCAASVAAS
jgi:hypothetical protein